MVGIVLIVIGIAGRLWSTLYIGGRKSALVVADGPYSITRNPLYVFSSVAAVGVGAQMGIDHRRHRLRCRLRRRLPHRHPARGKIPDCKSGAPYQAYLAKVPRFFPKLSLYDEGEPIGFRPSALMMTLLDGLVFLVAMPLFELIDAAQESGTLPVLFHLP